jgi:hypothetical protein
MSIIIVKKIENTCAFMSDTKVSIDSKDKSVTGNDKLRLPPEEGVLKIHILFQSICIAFAGTVNICTNILHNLCTYKPRDINLILKFLQDGLIQNNDDSAFIASFATPTGLKLYKVDNKKIEEGESFWIGVKDAFSEFQHSYLKENEYGKLNKNFSRAFSDMLINTSIPSIGDFVIGAYYNTENSSFIYEEGMEVKGGFGVINAKAKITTALSEGTVNEGAFVVTKLVSHRIDKPAICLYFSKGKLGFLYLPISQVNKDANPVVIKNVSIEEFKDIILKDHEIEVFGFNIDLGKFKFIQK